MKKIIRVFQIILFGLILWPFLKLNKKTKTPNKEELKNTIIICNHYSNLDPFIIKKVFLNCKIVFIAHSSVKNKLWSKLLAWSFDTLYVSDDILSISVIKKCSEILNNGGTIAIFPEGHVNPTKFGFLSFKKGSALIAKNSKAKILPMFIVPSPRIFKRNEVFFDKMYEFPEYNKTGKIDDINDYLFNLMINLSLDNNKINQEKFFQSLK